MSTITVFDPAMCCSSGVCGPKPDQKLSVFSADLQHLESQGHKVTRYNLAQEPAAFVSNLTVKALLDAHKNEALPIIIRDGELISYGSYPSRDQLVALVQGNNVERKSAEGDQAENSDAKSTSCCCSGGC
ncbi:arsenite efflux transporter metallochaperone ArsD [Photobacterium rosenbergii]|uniref:arsenite efflux transporter metallochaperone ArsD n=1 Tax=Photobacterium rosenbergii TaxID=294936 RepID=UPI001C99E481|nr:arsenite efflux transporter metallochaperone ArsD [Photobacterium rosenbergii]MBY5948905.1 arsenite efflux transporter metallochaperone ArsD [Photobacterium rosenbergii]